MARQLQDILSELNNVYNPQRDVINQQMATLDPMQADEQKGLDAAKTDAFSDITDQANRRGLFYSGIPVSEEQKYTGSTFLPAVANLHAKYAQQKFNLQDALAKIQSDQYNQAYGIQSDEQKNDAALAAAKASGSYASPSFGLGGGSSGQVKGAQAPSIQQRADKGFNFNYGGKAISAAQYSQLTGVPYRTLLQQMANAGDNGARTALGIVGDDYGFNRGSVTNQSQLDLLKALGVNTGGYSIPSPAAKQSPDTQKGLAPNSPSLVHQLTNAFNIF